MSERVGHISATSISAYKACPVRYRLGYVESLRQYPPPQPLRFGTQYQVGLEALGNGKSIEEALDLATAVYETIPDYADPTEWAIECETIRAALVAYNWLYPADKSDFETVASEVPFELPCVNPETGRPTPNMIRVGRIDHIIRRKSSGVFLIKENKTTSKAIDSGSSYWQRLRLDTQSKFYIIAARDLQKSGSTSNLPGAPVAGLLHDVFHKPGISPKMLTQADSKAFVETGDYCGQPCSIEKTEAGRWIVDGVLAEIEPGKKEGTFALRETPGMFGARLLQDIAARPEYYFARREVPFTDDELLDFQHEVWAIQQNMNTMERQGRWFKNEQNCEATFKCAYCPICYNNVMCCDGKTTPPGFVRLRPIDVEQVEVNAE
jgi:hypothetical protein